MRLLELKPRWYSEARRPHRKRRRGQGFTFLCPCCRKVRLAVAFANPLDGGEKIPHFNVKGPGFKVAHEGLWSEQNGTIGVDIVPPGTWWQRTGDTFADLSLTPSVDASSSGHWHGFITNGEVR